MNKLIIGLVLVLGLSACSYNQKARYVHKHVNNMMFGTAVATMACDWGQTDRMAKMNWGNGRWEEANPILGTAPSRGEVALYSGAVIVGLVVAKKYLPEWAQSVLYAGTTAVETHTIVSNMNNNVPGLCGIGTNAAEESPITRE